MRYKEAKEMRYEHPRTYFSGDYQILEIAKTANLREELACSTAKATRETLKDITLIEQVLHLAYNDLQSLCSGKTETHVARKRILHNFSKTLVDLESEVRNLGRHTYKEFPLLIYFKQYWLTHFHDLKEKLAPIIQSEEKGEGEGYTFSKKTKARYFRVLYEQLQWSWTSFDHSNIVESFNAFYENVRKIQERLEQQKLEEEKQKAAEAQKQQVEETEQIPGANADEN